MLAFSVLPYVTGRCFISGHQWQEAVACFMMFIHSHCCLLSEFYAFPTVADVAAVALQKSESNNPCALPLPALTKAARPMELSLYGILMWLKYGLLLLQKSECTMKCSDKEAIALHALCL